MNIIWFGLYELNFLMVGFALGASTVWMLALIIRLHFLKKQERLEANHE